MIYVASGGKKPFALIGLKYSTEDTVTCSNGTKTLTAKSDNGKYIFSIPKEGTWTVSNGKRDEQVEITAEGQWAFIDLS